MQAILNSGLSWPLYGTASSRAVEQRALADAPAHALMRRAGVAVARLAMALAPHAQRIWVAAGPGNNGGDGLEAALNLHVAGFQVEVSLLSPPRQLLGDAADALRRALAAGVPIHAQLPTTPPAVDLAIDALLGLGGNRPATGELARAMALLNQVSGPRLAVDLPSGLDASTGQPHGNAVVQATHTLSLLTLKPGLFTAAGRDLAGEVWLDTLLGTTPQDMAIPDTAIPPDAWLTGTQEALACLPPRQHSQHKGSFGDVIVVAGTIGMTGAGLLAARAALAAGAGRVHLSLLDGCAPAVDLVRPELMLRPLLWQAEPQVLASSTVVCGCGSGDAVRAVLAPLLSRAGRLVLDADALNAVATDAGLRSLLRARGARGAPTILTPHPLEAARLLGSDAKTVQSNRLAAAQRLADEFAAVVLLKGSGTVIASPNETPRINPTGNAALATAGTGDVLAGWIGGTWAVAAAPGEPMQARALLVAAAAWHQGHAADLAMQMPLRASDLIEAMHHTRHKHTVA